MNNQILKMAALFALVVLFYGCNLSDRGEQCSTKVPQEVFEVMNDSVAKDYIKYSFDNNCKIDSSLKDLFAIRSIGGEEKYFMLAYYNCCEKSSTKNDVGYCNGYLAEHYFVTDRFELAAGSYGKVLSLLLPNGDGMDSLLFFQRFSNLSREDQNLYLTCLFSRANSYYRLQKYQLSRKDLDLGLALSRKINPIFLESFERGFN